MSNKTVMILLGVLAACLWAGLLALMNLKPPTGVNQLIFLTIVGLAVSATGVPLAYFINERWARPLGRGGDLNRAGWQGLLAGVLATLLMALRLMRILTWLTALILVVLVAVVQLMAYLRSR